VKITRIETFAVRVPIKQELAIRSGRGGSHLVSPFLLVKIHTDEGIVGLGEVSCTPRWSGEDQVTAAHFIEKYFAPLLIGESVEQVECLSGRLRSAVAGNYFTKAAIEMALWDLLGKLREKPAWRLIEETEWHGADRRTGDSRLVPRRSPFDVPTKWSVSGVAPAKAAEIATWAASQGFSTMKVKVGINPDDDVARVRAVRDAVGARVKLGVDANGGWPTPKVAIQTIQRLHEQCAIYFAEQPVPAGHHDEMAEVRRNVPVPIIADESVWTLEDARQLAHANAANVFSIYIGKAGGIGPAVQIARFARSVGIACTIGSNLELGVGSAAMIQLALGTAHFDVANYPCDIIGPMFYEDDVLKEPLPILGGWARALDQAGLGVELDEEKVQKYRVQ
jgi:muconate cycloisomerase